MISHLVCVLSLVVLFILQTTIFSQVRLVSGSADLILLFLAAWSLQEHVKNSWLWAVVAGLLISLVSAMPFFAPLIGYVGVVTISKSLQRRVWRTPLITMFIIVLLGTFFQQSIYVVVLLITGAPISWRESLDSVILPSALLNLIFSLPMYAIAKDLAGRISPQEVEA
jgi:rod shape-determining protein MreD